MNFFTKQKKTHRLTEQTYGFWGEGIVLESLMDMRTLLYSKWLTDKACMGAEFGEEWIHIYIWLGPFTVHLKLSQHF